MGQIAKCRVRQRYDWYRPLYIHFGDKIFAVGEIHSEIYARRLNASYRQLFIS